MKKFTFLIVCAFTLSLGQPAQKCTVSNVTSATNSFYNWMGAVSPNFTNDLVSASTTKNAFASAGVLAAMPTPNVANLWATSSNGTEVSSFVVANGTVLTGLTSVFTPTFGGPNGGSSTEALGRSNKPSIINGYFYYLPNTINNDGVIDIYGANATGTAIAVVASVDVNGSGNSNDLGFVRLGMSPDGNGWILAGDGATVYLVKFVPNGTNAAAVTIEDNNGVTLIGGAASTFKNGDICMSGTGLLYVLANDGSGTTQIFTGLPSGNTTTLTKKWDLVDNNGANFTGNVNGVAFDALGSLYISTATGLFYINQNTVNGPAGTVGCFLVATIAGLQDLASNSFPANTLLPVQLGEFAVTKQGSNAVLNWKTFSENNSDHFEIERSYDGISFTSVGTRQAAGMSADSRSYQFIDPITVPSGIIYYRLRTVDIDAKFTISKIVALKISGGPVKDISVYPNPFSTNLKVELNSERETAAVIRINNAMGQTVMSKNVVLQKGQNIVVLTSEITNLQPGVHLMEIITENGKITQKIIKR